jgi:XTP/dITP diphosphohydrolase
MSESNLITLVLASGNRHKLIEMRALLAGLPVHVVPYTEVIHRPLAIIEDGATFEENAIKKCLNVGREAISLTLADDSGLEVDALGGRPGVRSARFAHEHATDAENNAALLSALGEMGDDERTARFKCVLALWDPFKGPDSTPIVVEGVCEGSIARSASGSFGFGYDPLFLTREVPGKTMADLTDEKKNEISHRGRAMRALIPKLTDCLRSRLEDVERISVRRPSIIDRL